VFGKLPLRTNGQLGVPSGQPAGVSLSLEQRNEQKAI
jgi:hypothetical protein